MPTKPWKDLEGHYFRIDVGSTAAAAMQGDPYTIYYTTEGYIVLNGEMMGRTITDDSSPIQVIDLAALDPNTWYPVTCILPEYLPTNVLTIKHNLWGWAGPIPPWASHSSGFYAFMRVTCNPSRWGANVEKSLVTHNSSLYVKGASPIFFKRTTTSNVTDRNQSCAIFYLRGGTTYHGSIQIGNDLEIEKQYLAPWAVHPDGFTDKGTKETYLPISDTSKLPANIPDVPARLDTLESTVKTKADASAVYDRATVDQKIAATDAKNAAHKAVFSWINNGYKDAQLKQWMKIGTEDSWYIEPYAANRPDTKVGDKVTGIFPASDTKNLYILHFEIIGLEKNSAGKIIQGQLRVLSNYIIPNGEAGYKRLDNMEAAIGNKVDATAYLQKVDELEKKDGQLNTAIGQQAKRIDKVQDVGIVAFTDLEASVTNIQQASVSLNFAICYAEMQNVFVAKTIQNGVAKYYNNWPTAEMYNKDGVARADKLYMRFTNGTMVPYAYHPVMRKLVAIPAGMTSGTDSLENCIKKLETKDGELSTLIGRKADASAVYDRATVNRLLAAKQNTGNYVTAIGRMYPGGGPGLNVTLSSGAAQGVSVADNANESRDGYMSAADYKLLHQGVLKNSLLPEVYEQAHRNGRLQVTQTVTIPDYAKEIHILQSSNIEVRIPSAMQENGYGITFYCEGHTGTATIRSTVPMWYLDANGRIAQSNRLVMTFGSALCITWRGGSRTAIQLSPVPITPA